jgi:DNA invertase Pin-like site-specific DNA recombinase
VKTAYSYVRWSSALQGKEGRDSKTRQTNSAREWIQNHGGGKYVLSTDVFIDPGKSGYKGEHIEKDAYGRAKGELLRFIELVENGTIKSDSILLVDSFDRFSRLPPMKSLELFSRVINSGIGLVFTGSRDKRVIDDTLITKDGYILQFIVGEMLRSFEESSEKSRKIKAAKQTKLARLRNGEKLPHNNVPKYFSWNPQTKAYEHNENTPHIKKMVEDFLNGHSLYSIAKRFNKDGIPTFRRGFQWAATSVRCILRNRVLVGEFLGNKNFFPPIIDGNTFNRLQVILAHNQRWNRGRQGEFINIFRGLAFCRCGKSMSVTTQTGKWSTKKKYRYLRCSTNGLAQNCPYKRTFSLEKLEQDLFLDFLMQHPMEMLADNSELRKLNSEIAVCQTRISGLDRQITKLAVANEELEIEELKEQLAKLNAARTEQRHILDTLNLRVTQFQTSPAQHKTLRDLIQQFDAATTTAEFEEVDDAIIRLIERLTDNQVRMKLRTILPTLIGKIVVDSMAKTFEVYNHSGKMVYGSENGHLLVAQK